jgi:divalent metal cation (Fe/Co/Zn/Cd) transporter
LRLAIIFLLKRALWERALPPHWSRHSRFKVQDRSEVALGDQALTACGFRPEAACQTGLVTPAGSAPRGALLRRGFALEYVTLAWNIAGIVVLAIAAVAARSVALAGFGLDSLIEIGASTVVIWELSGTGPERQSRGLRLIGYAFAALAVYLLVQSTVVLAAGFHPRRSVLGIAWTAVTAVVMFALASGKARAGRALDNPVLRTEGRVTMIDGILAAAVLAGLVLNAGLGWWWADPAAGYVLVYYAAREVREIVTAHH